MEVRGPISKKMLVVTELCESEGSAEDLSLALGLLHPSCSLKTVTQDVSKSVFIFY